MSVLSGESVKVSVKGGLLKAVEFWQTTPVPGFILSIIQEGYKIPFVSTPPSTHFFLCRAWRILPFRGILIRVLQQIFKFTVLPFGLSSALFIFSNLKLLKLLETLWRSLGVPMMVLEPVAR